MSGMEFAPIKEMEDAYQLKTYAKHNIAIERGQGNYVFDSAGRRYLDFYGGHCVTTRGTAIRESWRRFANKPGN